MTHPVNDPVNNPVHDPSPETGEHDELVEDGLVEEISIDGMCGVY